jgi:hypothetical protein
MSSALTPLARALALAALSGSRATLGPALLAASRRRPSAGGWVAAAVGEMLLDKVGVLPPRWEPALLIPRTLTGAWVAWDSAKEDGADAPLAALAGAVVAAGVASVAPMVRIALGQGAGIPDPILGVAEDYLGLQIGARAVGWSMTELVEVAKDSVTELGEQIRPALESVGLGG